ncbi:hypothetical protein ASC68_07060 [Devosia sp. Root105]|nr:hypothetical protein ASC68_07060 [Devosia sp. Root105]
MDDAKAIALEQRLDLDLIYETTPTYPRTGYEDAFGALDPGGASKRDQPRERLARQRVDELLKVDKPVGQVRPVTEQRLAIVANARRGDAQPLE